MGPGVIVWSDAAENHLGKAAGSSIFGFKGFYELDEIFAAILDHLKTVVYRLAVLSGAYVSLSLTWAQWSVPEQAATFILLFRSFPQGFSSLTSELNTFVHPIQTIQREAQSFLLLFISFLYLFQ